MSDSSDISNNSGPGSAAEPSMEEILASIRRILKEDEGVLTPGGDDEEDVLLLDASMIVAPADISSATELPAATGLLEGHEESPLPPPGPVYSAPEPALEMPAAPQTGTGDDKLADAAPPALPKPRAPKIHETVPVGPEPVPLSGAHEKEALMEDHVQLPDGLVGDTASHAIANTIGALIDSIGSERRVTVSRGGITIEDIVREEIKPVLKAWFDTHLPSLVERIVRAEIGRVVDRSQP